MSRAKVFISNFFTYGLLQVFSKIVPFLMIPLITRVLPDTAAFGMYDMYSLIIGMGIPLATVGINDAIYREYFETDDPTHGIDVTTTAHRTVLIASTIIALVLIMFKQGAADLFFNNRDNGIVIMFGAIGVWISANSTIFQTPTRIQNKTKVFVVTALFNSGGYYLLALWFILWGTSYYGLIYSKLIISGVVFLAFYGLNRRYFKGIYSPKIAKDLLRIGIPSIPTLLIYWLYNSMDRIMILNLLGPAELGVYAIGAKMAQISLLIYGAFAGGWQYFAYNSMKNRDFKEMIGKVWEILFVVSTCFYFLVFHFKDFIFNLLFEGDFKRGVVVFPYLLLGPLLLMLFQILSTQLNIAKKTYITPLILSIGAILNVFLNILLIPKLGGVGAAMATTIGYTASLTGALLIVVKIKQLMIIKPGIWIVALAFSALFVLVNIEYNLIAKILVFCYILICGLFYQKILTKYLKNLMAKS